MLEYARIFAYRTDMNLIGRDGRTDGRDRRTDAQTTLSRSTGYRVFVISMGDGGPSLYREGGWLLL
jgi:hypothetical protein